jgi:Ribonuclease G/E
MTYLVIESRVCDACGGRGVVAPEHPFCNECGREYTWDEIKKLDDIDPLPCGHAYCHLLENFWCSDCEGTGHIRRAVTLTEALAKLGLTVDETLCK